MTMVTVMEGLMAAAEVSNKEGDDNGDGNNNGQWRQATGDGDGECGGNGMDWMATVLDWTAMVMEWTG